MLARLLTIGLPLILEWVDAQERVAGQLPRLATMLDGGLVTTGPVEIVRYTPHQDKEPAPLRTSQAPRA